MVFAWATADDKSFMPVSQILIRPGFTMDFSTGVFEG
jgi:hypothetical protein